MFFYITFIAYVVIVFIIPLKQSFLLHEEQKRDQNSGNNFYYRLKSIQIHHANFGWHIILSFILFLSTISIGKSTFWEIGFFSSIFLIVIAGVRHLYYLIQATHYSTELNALLNKGKIQLNQVNQSDTIINMEEQTYGFRIPVIITGVLIWIIFGIFVAIPDIGNDLAVTIFFIYSFFMILIFIFLARPSGKIGWLRMGLQIIIFITIVYFTIMLIGGGR